MCSWLDDPSQTYFTAAQCNVWINLAQRHVQQMLLQAGENWYMRPVETTLVEDQYDYVLPSDFLVEHRIEIVISGSGVTENRQPLLPITTNQQDLVSVAAGVPSNYFIKKDRITISPAPQQSYTMRLYYSPRVADLGNDADTPDVPEQFMEFVAVLAALDGFIKDDRASENLMAKKLQYETLIKQMAEDRLQDQPRMVVMNDDTEFGALF